MATLFDSQCNVFIDVWFLRKPFLCPDFSGMIPHLLQIRMQVRQPEQQNKLVLNHQNFYATVCGNWYNLSINSLYAIVQKAFYRYWQMSSKSCNNRCNSALQRGSQASPLISISPPDPVLLNGCAIHDAHRTL